MSLFKARAPRKYRPRRIYTSEREEKLKKLVNEVRREQGEKVDEPYDPTKFRGMHNDTVRGGVGWHGP